MKIAIFNPKDSFTTEQQKRLSFFGQVSYTKTREPLPLEKLLEMAKGADIVGCDPDPLGGFEKAKEKLTEIMRSLPNLKGLCLTTTSFGWVDLNFCRERELPVSNVPGYSRESVAEQTIAFLLGASKRIFISDRRTQSNKYVLTQGFELKGKTLGIIGLGNIGSRVAELALGIGMKVIAYNRTPMKMKSIKMVSLDQLFKNSDAISLNTTHEPKNDNMIGKVELAKMKKGVIIVNTVDRELVDEKAMAQALKLGQVDTYVYEAEDLVSGPLGKIENAIGFQGFAWYTKEALENLYNIFIENLVAMAKGKPQNVVN
ncbi:MAG TPA: NAD(P)-dependent oxidoreductase [Alphaproteobacteria bacterium]|jgi:lactate dehydrogenase-like 2-hydroxyacid dehydrogenase|nr:NAD(P)-dependent oxidoreductase [Alphaproteobacteria bacterium]